MFKRYLRWIAPLIALAVLATCMALATLTYTHAAAPTIHTPSHTVSQPYNVDTQNPTPTPYVFKRGY